MAPATPIAAAPATRVALLIRASCMKTRRESTLPARHPCSTPFKRLQNGRMQDHTADALHRIDFWSWRIHCRGQPCGLQRSTLVSCHAAAWAACRCTGHKCQLALTCRRQHPPDFFSLHIWSSHEHRSTPWQCKSCSGSCEVMARPACER